MFKNMIRKVMPVLLAATLLVTGITPATANAASNVRTLDSTVAKVKYGYFKDGKWEVKDLTVKADLDDTYAEEVGYTDNSAKPTMLDATIALHKEVFGDNSFKVSQEGWITKAFGIENGAFGYKVNNADPDAMLNAVIKDDDVLTLFNYVDEAYTYTGFNKAIVYTHGKSTTTEAGTVKLTATMPAWTQNDKGDWVQTSAPAAGLTIALNGNEVGKTDENGVITFPATEEGIVTAVDAKGVAPMCFVSFDQTFTVKTTSKTFKATTLKKKSQRFTLGVKANSKMSVSCKKLYGNKMISVSDNGTVTFNRGKYKKGTYEIEVQLTPKGLKGYNKNVKVILVTVKVK